MHDTERTRLVRRIDELIPLAEGANRHQVNEAVQGALTLLKRVYGAGSTQESNLQQAFKVAQPYTPNAFRSAVAPVALGTLRALRSDVELGLVGEVARQVAGEILGDMLGLAKDALSHGGDDARNVAAVLTAAAFEDIIRRMGESLAGVSGRPDLQAVILALKQAGVLAGSPLTTAQGYLKFRNDALHADWSKINTAVVGSCISFVEHLLLEHFS